VLFLFIINDYAAVRKCSQLSGRKGKVLPVLPIRGLWGNPILSIPLLLKTVSMAQVHNHQERTKPIREAEDKHLIAHEGYPCEILSSMPYCRSFAGLANFTNRVSYKKASSADPRKRKARHHVEDTAPQKRGRSRPCFSSTSSSNSPIYSRELVDRADDVADNGKSQIVEKAIDLLTDINRLSDLNSAPRENYTPIEGDDVDDFNASPTSIGTGSSSLATVANGSTHPERLIANNATHNFIWTSGLEYSDSIEKDYFEWFTIPKVNISMYTIASICPAFEQSNFSALRKTLGYGFAFMAGKFQRVHQGVLMIEIIKHSHQRRTIYQRLELLLAQSVDTILETTRATSSNGGYDAVIILDYDSNPECVKRLRALASLSENWSRSGRRIRIFPHKEELEWYHCKINDIIALNELACHAEATREHAMAYQPLTCHGTKVCSLISQETVMKASYSSETRHVHHLGL
jgi:hypothetical protein